MSDFPRVRSSPDSERPWALEWNAVGVHPMLNTREFNGILIMIALLRNIKIPPGVFSCAAR
jgi:hypothetical protein